MVSATRSDMLNLLPIFILSFPVLPCIAAVCGGDPEERSSPKKIDWIVSTVYLPILRRNASEFVFISIVLCFFAVDKRPEFK